MIFEKVIIYPQEENSIAILYPVDNSITLDELIARDFPNVTTYKILDSSKIPEDIDFFNAFEYDFSKDGEITINLQKAKEITKQRLRQEREKLLMLQDVAFQRALETGSDTTEIVAEKQRLRDITQLVDNAETIEELKSIGVN